MEVVGMIGLVFFLICITRLMVLDLIAYKEYKEAEKIALESLETSHEIDKIFMKMENDLKKMLEEKLKDYGLYKGEIYD